MNAMSDYTRTGDSSFLVGKTKNSIFCDFEDPDYAVFFKDSVEAVGVFEAGRITSADAAKRIFDMANQYELAVPIREDALVRAHWMVEEDELTTPAARSASLVPVPSTADARPAVQASTR